MQTNTFQFTRGLMTAGKLLRGFRRDVHGVDRPLGAVAATAGKVHEGISGMAKSIGDLVASGASSIFSVMSGAISGLANFLGNAVKSLIVFTDALAAGAAVLAVSAVKSAIDFGEQIDRARIVFGKFADDVILQADQLATAFGVSKTSFVASASALGAIFEGAGYGTEAIAKLSTHFVKLATDVGSFVHIPVEEALAKLKSGLAGESEPLRSLGVFLTEDAIKLYAAAHGIAAVGRS